MTEQHGKQLTIRDVSYDLLAAMDLRKRHLNVSREAMLKDILANEFRAELGILRQAQKRGT